MLTMSRRELVLGAGVAAGCLDLKSVATADLEKLDAPTPFAVLARLRLSGEREQAFLARLGQSLAPRAQLPSEAPGRDARTIEAHVETRRDARRGVVGYGLRFACDARYTNRLCVSGKPLIARRVSYSLSEISWSPGEGLPVYDQPCPRYEDSSLAY